MKSIFTFIYLQIFSFVLFGQVQVGLSYKTLIDNRPRRIKPELNDIAKGCKTYFPVFNFDSERLAELQTSLTSVWNFNELKLIPAGTDSSLNNQEPYCIFKQYHVRVEHRSNGGSYSTNHYLMRMLLITKEESYNIAQFELDLPLDGRQTTDKLPFRNYSVWHLKGYLSEINYHLTNRTRSTYFTPIVSREMANLKDKKLFVSQEIGEIPDIKRALSIYPYPYEIVAPARLTEIMKESIDEFYLLNFVSMPNQRIVSIFNRTKGECIYNFYTMGEELKRRDMRRISKRVR